MYLGKLQALTAAPVDYDFPKATKTVDVVGKTKKGLDLRLVEVKSEMLLLEQMARYTSGNFLNTNNHMHIDLFIGCGDIIPDKLAFAEMVLMQLSNVSEAGVRGDPNVFREGYFAGVTKALSQVMYLRARI